MKRPNYAIGAVAAAALALGFAVAQAAPAVGAKPPALGVLGVTPLSNEVLATRRGGHAVDFSVANMHAKVSQNKAWDTVTGDNFVGQSALSNSSGFNTVVQNSGNNVIIQNSTIVNLKMQ